MKEEGFFLQNFVNMLSNDVYRLHFEAPNNPKFGYDELMSQKLWESRLKMMFSVKEAMDRRKVQRHLKLTKNGCVDLMVVGEDTIKSLGISTFQVYELSMEAFILPFNRKHDLGQPNHYNGLEKYPFI